MQCRGAVVLGCSVVTPRCLACALRSCSFLPAAREGVPRGGRELLLAVAARAAPELRQKRMRHVRHHEHFVPVPREELVVPVISWGGGWLTTSRCEEWTREGCRVAVGVW